MPAILLTFNNPRMAPRISNRVEFGRPGQNRVLRSLDASKETLNQACAVSPSFNTFVGVGYPTVSRMNLPVTERLVRTPSSCLPDSTRKRLERCEVVLYEEEVGFALQSPLCHPFHQLASLPGPMSRTRTFLSSAREDFSETDSLTNFSSSSVTG